MLVKQLAITITLLMVLLAGCTVEKADVQSRNQSGKSGLSQTRPNAEVDSTFGESGQMLVTMADINQIALVDLKTYEVSDVIDVGENPQDVIFSKDGASYYAVMAGAFSQTASKSDENTGSLKSNAVWTWDTAAHKITGKSSLLSGDQLEMPVGLAIDAASSRLYITNRGTDTLLIKNVTGKQDEVIRIPVGSGPSKVLVSPDDKYLVTINSDPENKVETDTVSIIYLLSQEVIAHVEVGDSPYGGCMHPDNQKFYVTVSGNNEVKEISLQDGKISNTFSIGTNPKGIVVSPDGSKLYIASYDDNAVIPYSLSDSSTLDPVSIGKGPTEIRSDDEFQILFVANESDRSISVYNIGQEKIIQTIKLKSTPTSMAVWSKSPPATKLKQSTAAKRDLLSPTGVQKTEAGSVETSGGE